MIEQTMGSPLNPQLSTQPGKHKIVLKLAHFTSFKDLSLILMQEKENLAHWKRLMTTILNIY
jgi:hypothetical protein